MISFETAIEAAAAFFLAVLLAVAVVTVLKGRYFIFAVGFLTFGLVWFPGALGLAPPESWWARRLYDDRQLARAKDPERYPRSWWRIPAYLAAMLACVAAVGATAARPTPILAVNGKALEYSIAGGPPLPDKACRRASAGSWTCGVWDNERSGAVPYRVDVDGLGCWNAQLRGQSSAEGGKPQRLSGCITIFDHLRLLDRVIG